jgi:hypothetical protein
VAYSVECSFELLSIAQKGLADHYARLARSHELVSEARVLCARADALLAQPSALRDELPHESAPADDAGEELLCAWSGCGRTASFHPCFVVNHGIRRVLIGNLPIRVCSDHRVDLDALLRRPSILESLRQKLRGRGRVEPDAISVVFEVVA